MSKKKKLLFVILIFIVALQFLPTRNNNGLAHGANDINNTINVPADVEVILQKACYDCHSNKTNYKWYCYIQPLGAWIEHHVDEGKDELNFSEFKSYTSKRQKHKLKECIEMVQENEMPVSSYLLVHKEAELTESEKSLLLDWFKTAKSNY